MIMSLTLRVSYLTIIAMQDLFRNHSKNTCPTTSIDVKPLLHLSFQGEKHSN